MRDRRGFTLVEILIALTVSAITLVAAIAAANAQQRAFYNGQKLRAAENMARAALLFLEQKLPLAGLGMDAPLALDFGWYATSCPAPIGSCARDKTGDADELVFYARDPRYWVPDSANGEPKGLAWHFSSLTLGTIAISARPGDVFRAGQILQAVCTGDLRFAYFTVARTARAPAAGGTTYVPLAPVDPSNPFKRQDVAMATPCMNVPGGARLFEIDRYRFYIRPVSLGSGRWDPFLVLDTGTDAEADGDFDLNDEVLIAQGIEAMQVSYVFASPTLPIAGGVPGQSVTLATGAANQTPHQITRTQFPGALAPGQFAYEPTSFYKYGLLAPLPAERLTNHQANIRTIRIAVVARAPEPDPTTSANLTWDAGSPLFRGNQGSAPSWIASDGRYQRAVLETSVNLPNMTVRGMSYF